MKTKNEQAPPGTTAPPTPEKPKRNQDNEGEQAEQSERPTKTNQEHNRQEETKWNAHTQKMPREKDTLEQEIENIMNIEGKIILEAEEPSQERRNPEPLQATSTTSEEEEREMGKNEMACRKKNTTRLTIRIEPRKQLGDY